MLLPTNLLQICFAIVCHYIFEMFAKFCEAKKPTCNLQFFHCVYYFNFIILLF